MLLYFSLIFFTKAYLLINPLLCLLVFPAVVLFPKYSWIICFYHNLLTLLRNVMLSLLVSIVNKQPYIYFYIVDTYMANVYDIIFWTNDFHNIQDYLIALFYHSYKNHIIGFCCNFWIYRSFDLCNHFICDRVEDFS